MIEITNISKDFKKDFWSRPYRVLDGVSFKIRKGKITGFLGTNGIGKTTTINIILKFTFPTDGLIKYSEELLDNHGTFTSKIGYLPERPYFYPNLTGKEYLTYMAGLNGINKFEITTRIDHWAQRLNISNALDRKIKTYSKGMAQRIGFISSVIHEPELIILDEPLSGLDPIGRKEIKDIFTRLNAEGKTIFFTTHVVSDVEEICHEVVVLDRGKIQLDSSLDNLIFNNSSLKYAIKFKDNQKLKSLDLSVFKTLERHMGKFADETVTFLVGIQEKDELVAKLVTSGIKLSSINPDHARLEDILYRKNESSHAN